MRQLKFNSMQSNQWYNFQEIWDKGYRLNIIHGVMDDGKTFGAKEMMLKRFIENGEISVWIRNSVTDLRQSIGLFTRAHLNNNPNWKNYTIKSIGDDLWGGYYNGELMNYFMSISKFTKSEREDSSLLKNVFWDEYNFIDTRLYNMLFGRTFTLFSRMMHVNRIFLIGNSTSVNHPLLYALSIWSDGQWEWNEYDLDDKYKILLHKFRRDKDQIEEKYKDSIVYAMMKKSGYAKHAFENESLNDTGDHILEDFPLEHSEYKWTINTHTKELYLSIYQFRNKLDGKYHYYIKSDNLLLNKNVYSKVAYATDHKLVRDGVKYNVGLTEKLGNMLQNNRVWYDSETAKSGFIEVISRFNSV